MDRDTVMMMANSEGWSEEVERAEKEMDRLGLQGISERQADRELVQDWVYSSRRGR